MENYAEAVKQLSQMMPALVGWFRGNRRKMPWREETSPYRTWISEIMLQQTRVDTVIPYFERFFAALPDIESLAACEEDRLLKLWEGLGYYSRARNMKKAANLCMEQYEGKLPGDYATLKTLPGIGSYTAGAIASIAFGRQEPVVDGNVLRVLSRLLLSYEDISKDGTKKTYEELLREVMKETGLLPGDFNQSLMELGALVCIPNGVPLCKDCPLQKDCGACLSGKTGEVPVKSPKKPRKTQKLTVFVLRDDNSIVTEKHAEKGLLSALYGLPSAEGWLMREEALAWLSEKGFRNIELRELPEAKHVFTHVDWLMKAYEAVTDRETLEKACSNHHWVPADCEKLRTEIPLATAYKKWDFF